MNRRRRQGHVASLIAKITMVGRKLAVKVGSAQYPLARLVINARIENFTVLVRFSSFTPAFLAPMNTQGMCFSASAAFLSLRHFDMFVPLPPFIKDSMSSYFYAESSYRVHSQFTVLDNTAVASNHIPIGLYLDLDYSATSMDVIPDLPKIQSQSPIEPLAQTSLLRH